MNFMPTRRHRSGIEPGWILLGLWSLLGLCGALGLVFAHDRGTQPAVADTHHLDSTANSAAIPEPPSIAMFGAGLAVLGWVGRKRKAKKRTTEVEWDGIRIAFAMPPVREHELQQTLQHEAK